jgi:hypothetical protein
MNQPLTLSAGPLSCRLYFDDHLARKTVQQRYGEYLNNSPSKNSLHIFSSPDLIPQKDEFNLRLCMNGKAISFFSSSTDGYFDPISNSGSLNIASSRLDNPATVENAFRQLFGILALGQGCVFFHGAACFQRKSAWIFLGPSGSGKSTVASFARERGYGVLSDDFVLLGGTRTLQVFSAPFFGQVRHKMKPRQAFDVRGIYLLRKAKHDTIRPICSLTEKIACLMANVPFAEMGDTPTLNRILGIVEQIGRETELYEMQFTHSPNFLEFLENSQV